MTYNFVGTTEVNDLMIWVYPHCGQVNIHNFFAKANMRSVEAMLKKCFAHFDLSQHGMVVYYNGASKQQVMKRCEELLEKLPIIILHQNNIQLVS